MKRVGMPRRKKAIKRSGKPMRRSRSTGNPTVAEVRRWDLIRKMPCLCCSFVGSPFLRTYGQPIEMHHLLSGGKRRGHMFTIGLCSWHHRAVPPRESGSMDEMTVSFGPSLANGSKPFHQAYASDDELLALQNEKLSQLTTEKAA